MPVDLKPHMGNAHNRREQYQQFLAGFAWLLDRAVAQGIAVRGGDWCRSQAQAAENAANGVGIVNSKHCYSLAVDLDIVDPQGTGKGINYASVDYKTLGALWQSIGGNWGGDFTTRVDMRHFEHPQDPL